jgi:hypothetical protein
MAYTLSLRNDYVQPTIVCDRCGAVVSSSGFHVWNTNPSDDDGAHATAQLCGDECLDAFVEEQPEGEEWLAIPIDAYLANLVTALNIDLERVLERERAVWAAEHTRHEGPD